MFDVHVRSGFGKRYRITRDRLSSARPEETLEDFWHSGHSAEWFVKGLHLSDYDLSQLVVRLVGVDRHSHWMSRVDYEERLAELLIRGDLLVFSETPAKKERKATMGRGGVAGRKPKAKPPEEPVPTTTPTLGPHDEPGYQPPPEASVNTAENANPPAQSLEECEQRLAAARERLKKDGYQPKYTDDELQAMAATGELDDRFVMRMMETTYAGDDGRLGQADAQGRVKYWSTTFNQAENADTDPDTLAPLLGFTPKPGADYTLVVVDTQAPGAGQSVTLVPTYENMANLAKGEIKGVDSERVDEVMTPEYSEEYDQHMAVFESDGLDVKKRRDINDYADEKISNVRDKERFKARAAIHGEFGANQHFTGDGTTKNLLSNGGARGAVETYTLDKNPRTLADLENRSSAKRLPAKRL